VFIPQTVLNNWTRKRNQVIPFVQGGRVDVNTNRFPGGTLGGSVGQDLFEPAPATGASFVDVLLQYETPGAESFTVPLTVSSITVRLTAAGGAGGDAYASKDFTGSGGGGGSGGFVETTVAVQTNQVYNLQVGAGGDRNGNRRGGITSISRGTFNLSVTGGSGGGDGLPTTPGQTVSAGGTAGSPIGIAGRAGTISYTTSNQVGGRGADMFTRDLGTGGAGGTALEPTGRPGFGFGAGGGGAGTQRGTTSPWPGGAGAPGRIEIQYRGLRFVFVDNINVDTLNYSIRTEALASGWDGQTPLEARITVSPTAYVYSNSTNTPAISFAGLPPSSLVTLRNEGVILGKGGNGGGGYTGSTFQFTNPIYQGQPGGPALLMTSNVTLILTNVGTLAGGGGGGGGGGSPGNGGGGGGGGSGGGDGGRGSTGAFGNVQAAGGAGGAVRGTGSRGAWNGTITGFAGGGFGIGCGGGGGGGRIVPGTGGNGGPAPGSDGNVNLGGFGGGSGGGGGGFAGWYVGGPGGRAGDGGSAGNEGGTRALPGEITVGGGGGGWGATGGRADNTVSAALGGVGGKAIDTRGLDVVVNNSGTIFGAISGSSITGVFSAAITTNQTNANLRTLMVNAGWNQTMTAVSIIGDGTYIYSTATATPALTVNGSWPNGVKINNYGFIMGQGGAGGSNSNGAGGGNAVSITLNISLLNAGTIAGGGGGGGAGNNAYAQAGGGGGAGAGVGGTGGGPSRPGGAGGGPGAAGNAGTDLSAATGGAGGGGAGRILPGTGGAGGAGGVLGGSAGRGGGAGGGGAGWYAIIFGPYGPVAGGGGAGAAGGSGANAGNSSGDGGTAQGGGGGGGWAATGGSGGAQSGFARRSGGTGGKAINLNGNTVAFFQIGTIYGSIS